jgi:hypothetical protein
MLCWCGCCCWWLLLYCAHLSVHKCCCWWLLLCCAAHLKELWQQLAAQLLYDHDRLGPVTPHQQVLLRAGVRKAERACACSSSSSEMTEESAGGVVY